MSYPSKKASVMSTNNEATNRKERHLPIPVLPDVASITVCPGLSDPSFSAVSMMESARRSFTLESGLKNSHFA